MSKPLDPTKPVQLEDGPPARIICTDRKDERPIVALVGRGGHESVFDFCERDFSGAYRLINVPEKRVRWVNMYTNDRICYGYDTREDADAGRNQGRIACIRIEFEEGEGL